MTHLSGQRVALSTIARQWGRIGCIGFGGPPAHVAMLRRLCVEQRQWLEPGEFEDGIAVTNLLPGPASTQLAIFCAWRLRGALGALVGGLCFICPGLVLMVALSVVFLRASAPLWVLGAAAGAGAAVPAVAVAAAIGLVAPSWKRVGAVLARRRAWMVYGIAGAVASAAVGPWVVVVMVICGLASIGMSTRVAVVLAPMGVSLATGGLAAVAWVGFKVGALAYGGGFVIVPLMQADAVNHHHWMTATQFLNTVALGQITPGPVTLTVAGVGYAAAGVGGALMAAVSAFSPSFVFVMMGGPRFDRIRSNVTVQAFLGGAGPAAIGAIAGSAVPLAMSLRFGWQVAVLVVAAVWLLLLRRGLIVALVVAALVGVTAASVGAPIPR